MVDVKVVVVVEVVVVAIMKAARWCR